MPPAKVPGLDATVSGVMRRAGIPGLSLAVARNGRTLVARGYGWRDRETRLPATPSTVYGIASITKSFTALAVLRLEEDRRLKVTDPVVRHLPEFRTPSPRWTRRIRLHHLLTHSSGLPPLPSLYYSSIRSLARDPPYDLRVARRVGVDPAHRPLDTYAQVLRFLAEEPYRMLGPPGQFFSYSNEAFGLLGAVIERASGRTYESYVDEAILRPAGMRTSTFDSGIMFRFKEVTTLYSPKRTGPRRTLLPSQDWWEDTSLRASGGLRTNTLDLLSYLEIYRTGGRVGKERILSASSLRKMLRPAMAIRGGVHYGYGVAVRPDYHGSLLIFHSGGLKGVSSLFAAVPQKGIGACVLTNVEGADPGAILSFTVNTLLGLPPRTPVYDPPARATTPPRLSEFAGWFCSGEGIWARVIPRRDHLRLDFRGIELTQKGLRLWPRANDEFEIGEPRGRGTVKFLRDPQGRVSSLFLGWRIVRRRRPSELRRARSGKMIW